MLLGNVVNMIDEISAIFLAVTSVLYCCCIITDPSRFYEDHMCSDSNFNCR